VKDGHQAPVERFKWQIAVSNSHVSELS
jgi:hypothetical protein